MSHEKHGNPVATYIITALILGVITYIEFAIVEYEISWLSQGATLFWLVLLSVLKFAMVVAIFMHLKDDEATYTGFFGSGMILALATFVILPLLFTVSSFREPVSAQSEGAHEEASQLTEEQRGLIDTDGYSRERGQILDSPRPLDRSLRVEAPAAPEAEASLAQAEAEDAATEDTATEDTATEDTATEGTAIEDSAAQDDDGAAEAEAEQAAAEEAQAEESAEAQAQAALQQEEAADEEEAADDDAAAAEEPAAGDGDQAQAADFDRELGESVYVSNCASCHQAEGQGIPGAFPPLAGNIPQFLEVEGGRDYLIDVVLHGLSGQIEVDGQTYNGVMPPWASQLDDQEVAEVLNYSLTEWDEPTAFDPIGAGEVEERRGQDPGDLNERRSELTN